MSKITLLAGGCVVVALTAGCQQKTAYGPADIAPSPFVLALLDQRAPAPALGLTPQPVQPATAEPVYTIIDEAPPAVQDPGPATIAIQSDVDDAAFVAPVSFEYGAPVTETVSVDPQPPVVQPEPVYTAAPPVQYVDETVYLDSTEAPAPSAAYAEETVYLDAPVLNASTLDAPVLEGDIVPVLGNSVAPVVIESAPLAQPGVTPYGSAF